MVLVQKWPFFQLFLSGNIGEENAFYDTLEQKNAFLASKKKKSYKSKKKTFFQKNSPLVLAQKWPYFQLFFLGNTSQKNVFYKILERINTFLGYKKKKSRKSTNWHFSKGVNPWFWSKNGHFSNFFILGKIGQKMFFMIFKNVKRLSRL